MIISTVGPYQLYGEGLLAACAAAGTDYVDLCGEPAWMAAMIRKYGDAAQASSVVLIGTNFLSNSQCSISAQGSSIVTSGSQLTVNLNITLKPAFTGPKAVWMAVQTIVAQTSPWQAIGAVRVP